MPLSAALFHVDASRQNRWPGPMPAFRRSVPFEEEKSRKEFVRMAAIGLLLVHIPALIEEGGLEGVLASEECLWRGALKTEDY